MEDEWYWIIVTRYDKHYGHLSKIGSTIMQMVKHWMIRKIQLILIIENWMICKWCSKMVDLSENNVGIYSGIDKN